MAKAYRPPRCKRKQFTPPNQKWKSSGAFLVESYPAPSTDHPLKRNPAKAMCWQYCTSKAALKSYRDRDGIYAAQ